MAKKIYNNKSDNYSDWTTKFLKETLISLDEAIYGEASCYGKRDLYMMSGVTQELEKRGVTIRSRVVFD